MRRLSIDSYFGLVIDSRVIDSRVIDSSLVMFVDIVYTVNILHFAGQI